VADDIEVNIEALRAEYRNVAGKKHGPKWDAETLAAKIEEAKAAPPAAPEVEGVKIVITAAHVYLPLDENGNCFAWEGDLNQNAVKVERRTRLLVHPDMAASLQKQDRAEILE
jgi:hypothetical protein